MHRGVIAISIGGLKIVAAILAFVLTMEICARADDALRFGAPFWEEYSADRLRTYDSDGIQVNVPNERFEKWRHNRLGFRGLDQEVESPRAQHIVCLGASESYGLYESPGKEWPAQLRSVLPVSAYRVTNASVAGLGLCSFKPYVQKYLLPLKPDVIVCVVNPSLYALFWEKTRKGKGQAKPLQPVTVQRKEKPGLVRRVVANIRLLPKAKQTFKVAVGATFPTLLQGYQVRNLQKQVARAEAEQMKGKKTQDGVAADTVAAFRADLVDLVSFIQSKGIRVMLTSYPCLLDNSTLEKFPQYALDGRRTLVNYSTRGLVDIVDTLNGAIASIAVERGTMFVDSRLLVPRSLEYFGDDCHYTDKGARIVAEGIGRGIMNNCGNGTLSAGGAVPNQQLGRRQ